MKLCKYKLVNDKKIFTYLQENKQYVKILNDLYQEIKKYFRTSEIFLELLDEFECPEPDKFRISIKTKYELQASLKKLKEFRINKFLKQYDPLETHVMFTIIN